MWKTFPSNLQNKQYIYICTAFQSTNFVAYKSNSSDDVSSGSCKQLGDTIFNHSEYKVSDNTSFVITYRGCIRACVVPVKGETRLGLSYCRTHKVKQVAICGGRSSGLHRLYKAISHGSCVLPREYLKQRQMIQLTYREVCVLSCMMMNE